MATTKVADKRDGGTSAPARRRCHKTRQAAITHRRPRRREAPVKTPRHEDGDAPAWLLRSPIYRRLPVRERARLDRAIILRPAGCKSIDAIAEHFHLVEKYGISVTALRTYAGKLEEFVKPTLTSQVLAGVLGCLPVSYRRRLVAGSEVMLVSRILQALNDEKMGLTVAELARLGSILSGLARRGAASNRPAGRGKPSGTDARPDESADRNGPDPVKMARTVRLLYGLSWPLSGTGRDGDGGGSGPSSPDGNRPSEAVRRSEEDPSHVHPEEGTP